MWEVVKDLGKEKLYKCSECNFQIVAVNPPTECPYCGEVTPQQPRQINLNRSTIEIDETDVGVYEYERETPVYKLWYFWLILILSLALMGGGMFVLKNVLSSEHTGSDVLGDISFTPPTGWTKVDDTLFTGPGEGSEIQIATVEKVSLRTDVDECAQLVAKLAGVDNIETKEINNIDGRLIKWKTRKIVNNKEVLTDFARYVFIYKGILYVVIYRSTDGTPEVFDTFISTIGN